jgi:hypothetical protein
MPHNLGLHSRKERIRNILQGGVIALAKGV